MKKAVHVLATLALGASLIGCQSTPLVDAQAEQVVHGVTMNTLSGEAFYRERIALPEHAVMVVTLEDVSIADKAATIVAQKRMTTKGKQVPLAFDLAYAADAIDSQARYSVRVQIWVDDELRFTSDAAYPVINNGAPTEGLKVLLRGVR
ncbi:lipo-like protein [Vibrio sp. SM6]|uniref:Lipo-like protein n=1 Tax=Vibrio agarilyticus TaxID=2726741 RepID=A0A7X8YHL7_9VIBR|nr:YbaY family lipoprotein [Vibrio agarilyticus]NLS13854.1 lipo-like protein [Vibrio agarilyticus]